MSQVTVKTSKKLSKQVKKKLTSAEQIQNDISQIKDVLINYGKSGHQKITRNAVNQDTNSGKITG